MMIHFNSSKVFSFKTNHFFSSFRRSEFLGCLMIPVKIAIRKPFSGSFLLQPQLSLNNPSPLIPEAAERMFDDSINTKDETCYQKL